MDENGVLSVVFDPVNLKLRTSWVATADDAAFAMDENGAWHNAYDPVTRTIRVVAV